MGTACILDAVLHHQHSRGAGRSGAVTDRILQNPKDFAQLFAPFFGMNIANQFQELLTQHLLIAADLVNAAKNGGNGKGGYCASKMVPKRG